VDERFRSQGGPMISYRVLTSGRAIRIPFAEVARRMPLGPYGGQVALDGVLAGDAARLRVEGPAEITISLEPLLVKHAIERFMEVPPAEIARVAIETLEGHIREVLSTLDSERAVHDPLDFQQKLMQESESDFDKLGLVLSAFTPTVRIQEPPPPRDDQAASPEQRMLARLADRNLSAEAKQAAVSAMGQRRFRLPLSIERTDPPSADDLPGDYQAGQSAFGLAPNRVEAEVVYPAARLAEVELMEGGGLEIETLVCVHRWDGPRQCLIVLAD
jgi:hypothetical protein